MQVNMYLCGGAGTNVGALMSEYHWDKKVPGMCQFLPLVVDTSDSNIKKFGNLPDENIHFLHGVKKGSGGNRKANLAAIKDQIPQLLATSLFAPSEFSIVIHSAGGGSGSVIGPTIVNELIRLNKSFVVITVGSYSSKNEAENTKNVLLGYEATSRKNGRPVVCIYRENDENTSRSVVDQQILNVVTGLSILFSGDNDELDPEDLHNFLNYPNVTPYDSALTMLDIFYPTIQVGAGQLVQSVVSLKDSHDDVEIGVPVRYRCGGVVPLNDEHQGLLSPHQFPMHFATVGGFFTPVLDRLKESIKIYDEADRVARVKPIDLADIEDDDDCLVT